MNLATIRRSCAVAGATLLSAASLTVGLSTPAEAATGPFYYYRNGNSPSQITNPPASQCIGLGPARVTRARNNTNATATLYSYDTCAVVVTTIAPGGSWDTHPFAEGAHSVKFSG